jgi:hypothetical protein
MSHTDTRFDAMCPTEEALAAFLAASGSLPPDLMQGWDRTALSEEELRALTAHVDVCDRCVEELQTASRRLALAAEMPIPVPAEVAARTAIVVEQLDAQTTSRGFGTWIAELGERLKAAISMPVLVPVALAALALIVVVPRLQTSTAPDAELSRAVDMRQSARVTADSAVVRKEPAADGAVIKTLKRGEHMVLIAQQGDWYRVALADGGEGWIERRAFE